MRDLKKKKPTTKKGDCLPPYQTEYSIACKRAVEEAAKHPLTFEEAKRQVERKRRLSELGNNTNKD